jgi:hypothetical protein
VNQASRTAGILRRQRGATLGGATRDELRDALCCPPELEFWLHSGSPGRTLRLSPSDALIAVRSSSTSSDTSR